MKRLLFGFICMFLMGQAAKAQIGVTDGAHVMQQGFAWAEQLGHMATQLDLLSESEGYLNESINFYKKIHGTMKNSALIFKILESQYNLVEIAYNALTLDNKKIGSDKIYSKYRTTIMEIIERNNQNTKQTADYLKEGIFKMNDAERIEAAEKLQERTAELCTQIYTAKTHFETANRHALAIKRLNNK